MGDCGSTTLQDLGGMPSQTVRETSHHRNCSKDRGVARSTSDDYLRAKLQSLDKWLGAHHSYDVRAAVDDLVGPGAPQAEEQKGGREPGGQVVRALLRIGGAEDARAP